MTNILQHNNTLYAITEHEEQALFSIKNIVLAGTAPGLAYFARQLDNTLFFTPTPEHIASQLTSLISQGNITVCTKEKQLLVNTDTKEITPLSPTQKKLLDALEETQDPQLAIITHHPRLLFPEHTHLSFPPEAYTPFLLSKHNHNAELYNALQNATAQKDEQQLETILNQLQDDTGSIIDKITWYFLKKKHHLQPTTSKLQQQKAFASYVRAQQHTQDIILTITKPEYIYDLKDHLEKVLELPIHAHPYSNNLSITLEKNKAHILARTLNRKDKSILNKDTLRHMIRNARLASITYYPELLRNYTTPFKHAAKKSRTAYHLQRIHAREAQQITRGEGIKIAVLDTGIDYTHPELIHLFQDDIKGYNFINDTANPYDDEGHGTHVSGLVAGQQYGVAPLAKLYALKVLNSQGFGTETDIIRALEWCIIHNIDIINMSLGSSASSLLENEAIQAVHDNNITIFAAAGNEERGPSYPASYPGVISVAAVDKNNKHAAFSNIHPTVDISAPGVDIISAIPGGTYARYSGTSMATPLATGTGALIKSITQHNLEHALLQTARELGRGEREQQAKYGSGLVQAYEALRGVECITMYVR
jgi:hypothetical protein